MLAKAPNLRRTYPNGHRIQTPNLASKYLAHHSEISNTPTWDKERVILTALFLSRLLCLPDALEWFASASNSEPYG